MKEQILDYLQSVAQGLKNALCSAADYYNQQYQQDLQNHKQKYQQYQQQILKARIDTLQDEIQQELFDVMSQCHYGIIQQIQTLTHIRPAGWKLTRNGVIYRFMLSGTMSPAQFLLTNLKNSINLDISNYNRNLIATTSFPVAQMLHPHITSGLYILKITATGNDIILYVASNVVP